MKNITKQAIENAARFGHAAETVLGMSEADQAMIAEMERPMPVYECEKWVNGTLYVSGLAFYKKRTAKRGNRCKHTIADVKRILTNHKLAKLGLHDTQIGRVEVRWFCSETNLQTPSKIVINK